MENPLGQRLRALPGPLMLTGHTGFKGTWMTSLLQYLKIPAVGFSLPAATSPLLDRSMWSGAIPEMLGDIRDYKALESFMDHFRPSTIIHMAAQPLVLESYKTPRETFETNVIGTVNLLDIAFKRDFVQAVVIVTTDKVYRNNNSGQSFVETDPLDGKDPYSASKVGTEAAVRAWQQISKVSGGPKVVSVRAGNVIGGGDYSNDRIIPDLIRSAVTGKVVEIRNPSSVRPWQHVLDPITGYLMLIETMLNEIDISSLNFGPLHSEISVKEITNIGIAMFPELEKTLVFSPESTRGLEAMHLHVDSSNSMKILGWTPRWSSHEAIQLTFDWWKAHLEEKTDPKLLCKLDIDRFFTN